MIARVPLAFGALSGRFNAQTIFLGDDHRKNLYRGSSLQETLLKVKKLQFLAASSKSMPILYFFKIGNNLEMGSWYKRLKNT